MLRLFRDKHIYLLALEKSLQISKVIQAIEAKVAAYNRLYASIKKMKSLFRLAVGDLDTR